MSEKVDAMSPNLPCGEVRDLLILHAYGELPGDREEAVDAHLFACPACQAEQAALSRLHAAAGDAAIEPSFELLSACRQDLNKHIAAAQAAQPAWRRWLPASPFLHWAAKPAMAAALFGAGFGIARLPQTVVPVAAGPAPSFNVRTIDDSGGGRLRIVYDEIKRRELAGPVDDGRVRELLLAATRDSFDPALRVDSVEWLKNRCEREEVRKALVRTLSSDPNEGVRLKALEALKPYAGEDEVRSALTKVLLADQSAIVRTQTIDLLVATRRDEAELAGVLQGLMRREQNSYIRQRSQSALRAMNASLETF